MINIGINYITELEGPKNRYDNVYVYLIRNNYINTLKFPGKYCDYESLKSFMNIIKQENINPDIHGLPGMESSIHSVNCTPNIEWEKIQEILHMGKKITRMSTHIGLRNKEKLEHYKEFTFQENIATIKENMKKITGNDIKFGTENIPGGFEFDLKTLTPKFISNNWKWVDFGVFDISHAKLAANDLGMAYDEYLNDIQNKEKVKILHVSGNVDDTEKYKDKPDKHVLIDESEIKYIINALKIFKNVDLLISEYAYNTKYSYEKELIIEAITLSTIAKTMNEKIAVDVLR